MSDGLNLDLDPCVISPLSTGSAGYPQLKRHGVQFSGHRLAYELAYGPVPEGLHVMHRCNTKSCVNPRHLIAGTPQQNAADAKRDGLYPSGDRHANAKLTQQQVDEIVSTPNLGYGTGRWLANKFGVSESTVSKIRKGKRWAS